MESVDRHVDAWRRQCQSTECSLLSLTLYITVAFHGLARGWGWSGVEEGSQGVHAPPYPF